MTGDRILFVCYERDTVTVPTPDPYLSLFLGESTKTVGIVRNIASL